MALLELLKHYAPNTGNWTELKCDLNHPLCPTHGFYVFPAPGVMVNLLNGKVYNNTGASGYGHSITGPFVDFNNSVTTSTITDYFETEINDSFSELTLAASVDLSTFSTSRYYELVTRGSVFTNNTNFTWGTRQGSSSATESIFLYSRSSGGTLSGVEYDIPLSSQNKDFTVGSIFRSNGDIDTYQNGTYLNTDTTNTLYAGGTQKLRIGAGTSPTSTSSGYINKCHWVYVSDKPLSNAQMRSLMDNPRQILEPATPLTYFTTGAAPPTYTLTADPGVFTLAGDDVNFLINYSLQANAGVFTLAGDTANLNISYVLPVDPGVFTLAGDTTNLNINYVLNADTGAFALAGDNVDFTITFGLTADPGVFTLAGDDVNLNLTVKLTAEAGTFTLAGDPVNITDGAISTPDIVTYLNGEIVDYFNLDSLIMPSNEFITAAIDPVGLFVESKLYIPPATTGLYVTSVIDPDGVYLDGAPL